MTHLNQTLAQVEKHINKFRYLDYMFDQSDKLELCNNKFDRHLIWIDLLVAQVAALIEHERINMIRTWENICRECQQLSRLYHWGIEIFPHSSSHWLTQSVGHVIEPHGDAYLLSKCMNVCIDVFE